MAQGKRLAAPAPRWSGDPGEEGLSRLWTERGPSGVLGTGLGVHAEGPHASYPSKGALLADDRNVQEGAPGTGGRGRGRGVAWQGVWRNRG